MSALGTCERCQQSLGLSSGLWQWCPKCKTPVPESDSACPGCHGALERKSMSVVCCTSCGFPVLNHAITIGSVDAKPAPLRSASDFHVPTLDPLALHNRILAVEAGIKVEKSRLDKLEKLTAGRK